MKGQTDAGYTRLLTFIENALDGGLHQAAHTKVKSNPFRLTLLSVLEEKEIIPRHWSQSVRINRAPRGT